MDIIRLITLGLILMFWVGLIFIIIKAFWERVIKFMYKDIIKATKKLGEDEFIEE